MTTTACRRVILSQEAQDWYTYRATADRLARRIAVLRVKISEQRERARGGAGESWLCDGDLRLIEELVEKTIGIVDPTS